MMVFTVSPSVCSSGIPWVESQADVSWAAVASDLVITLSPLIRRTMDLSRLACSSCSRFIAPIRLGMFLAAMSLYDGATFRGVEGTAAADALRTVSWSSAVDVFSKRVAWSAFKCAVSARRAMISALRALFSTVSLA